MRSVSRCLLGGALGALILSSCVSGEEAGNDAPTPAFIDPLILSQNRCGGQAEPLGGEDETIAAPAAVSFDFDAPFALPASVIDHFHYPVATMSKDAQTWFDTGLAHMANFNHNEAIAAFREAQRLDPECAMCFWGEGLAFGSNINASFVPARGAAGLVAAKRPPHWFHPHPKRKPRSSRRWRRDIARMRPERSARTPKPMPTGWMSSRAAMAMTS